MTPDDLTIIAKAIHSALDDAQESRRETPTDIGQQRYEGAYEILALTTRRIAQTIAGTGYNVEYEPFVAACGFKP